jgi:hypothetical protein
LYNARICALVFFTLSLAPKLAKTDTVVYGGTTCGGASNALEVVEALGAAEALEVVETLEVVEVLGILEVLEVVEVPEVVETVDVVEGLKLVVLPPTGVCETGGDTEGTPEMTEPSPERVGWAPVV